MRAPSNFYACLHAGTIMDRKIIINKIDFLKAKYQNELIYTIARKVYKRALAQKRHFQTMQKLIKDSS